LQITLYTSPKVNSDRLYLAKKEKPACEQASPYKPYEKAYLRSGQQYPIWAQI